MSKCRAYLARPRPPESDAVRTTSNDDDFFSPNRRRCGAVEAHSFGLVDGTRCDADSQHESIVGEYAAEVGVDVLVAVGPVAAAIAQGFETGPRASSTPGVAITTAGRAEAADWLRHNVSAADVVLVKASRGAALEAIAEELLVIEGEGSSTT